MSLRQLFRLSFGLGIALVFLLGGISSFVTYAIVNTTRHVEATKARSDQVPAIGLKAMRHTLLSPLIASASTGSVGFIDGARQGLVAAINVDIESLGKKVSG